MESNVRPMNKKYIELKTECSNKDFCLEAALSEYIDNSIQSILDDYSEKSGIDEDIMHILETCNERNTYNIIEDLKKYNLTVELKFIDEIRNSGPTSHVRTLYVKDNACGIKHENLLECMEMNKTLTKEKRKNKDSMNVYGVGMKNASFYIGNNAIIFTKTANEDFVSIGSYQAPLDTSDVKMKDVVLMRLDKSNKLEDLYEIGKSGTIIKVEAVGKSIFNKINGINSNNDNSSFKNLSKTLGMKYFNYLKHDILKIEVINGDNGSVKAITADSMIEYDDNNDHNPFVIENYYKNHINKINEKTIGEFQQKLKNNFIKKFNETKNQKFKILYNENLEFRNIFDDINKPIVFKMNCWINKINKSFPVTVGILSDANQKLSNVNVLAQWRYINLPCFEKITNGVIKQYELSSNWRGDEISGKWSFIEFNLRDLPFNENFEFFKVHQNKTSFLQVNENDPGYTIDDINKSLKDIKKILAPFTDIFKELENDNEDKVINKNYDKNDFLSTKIENIESSEKSFVILSNSNEKVNVLLDDNTQNSSEIISTNYMG
ncbi:MAG: ATP-binding protein, partial [Ureaplasma sp.]|nr:ATP-binding protein [Ureaplasma sp.]